MALEVYQLPKDKKSLAEVINHHALREEQRLGYKRAMWTLSRYYLQGARRFEVFDPLQGLVTFSFTDREGRLEFQNQELISALDRIVGRLSSPDLRPKVLREDTSLGGLRDRNVAQLVMDALFPEDMIRGIGSSYAWFYAAMGSAGLMFHTDTDVMGKLSVSGEVIPPWELVPFPSTGVNHTKTFGLMRTRYVPTTFLESVFSKDRVTRNEDKLDEWRLPVGETMNEMGLKDQWGANQTYGKSGSSDFTASAKTDKSTDGTYRVARIRETFLKKADGTLARYIVTCGDWVAHDEDFSDKTVPLPIGFQRFMDNGTFHGMGLFDLLYPLNREMERLLKSLFTNVRDIDRYGILVLPQGEINENNALRDVGNGLRVMFYDPDPIAASARPTTIQPFNSGTVPGQTASFAQELLQSINPIRDLIEEKGRVDSYAGLSFIDEKINEIFTNQSAGMERAFSEAYRSAAVRIMDELALSGQPIPVSRLDLDLVGVVINPDNNMVQFRSNPVPDILRLRFTIKNRTQQSATARKMEALELLQLQIPGVSDPHRFILTNLDEGLDFAFWGRDYESAYSSVVRNILYLYGDGQTPGQIVLTPHTAKPEFQIEILNSFMSRPEMGMASPEVQNAFLQYQSTLMAWLGMVLPQGVPNPDDIMATSSAGQVDATVAQMGSPFGADPRQASPDGQEGFDSQSEFE